MRLLFVFLLLFFASQNLFSQNKVSLTGSIKDIYDESLIGISIYLSDNKDIGTTTDYDGKFSFEFYKPLPVNITISGIGYETKSLIINEYGSTIMNFIMDESVLFGDEVIVSASLFEQNILTSPVSIERLNILDIEQSSAANFYDEL